MRLKNPFFTGIPGGIASITGYSASDLLGMSGLNTGNFLFVSALRKLLGNNCDVYRCESYYKEHIAECEYFAISAANWINSSVDLGELAALIENTNLPCLVVGLGVQLESDYELPKLMPGTKRFLDVVSERSKLISVRGFVTQEVLSRLGIHNTYSTGCPSLLSHLISFDGLSNQVKDFQVENIVLQGTRHGLSETFFRDELSARVNRHLYRLAISNNSWILIQSEVPDINIKLKTHSTTDLQRQYNSFLERVYGCEANRVNEFIDKKSLLYFDVNSLVEGLKGKHALVGTRIHGVVSGLISGLPSLLLTHDARTQELASIMKIPALDIKDIGEDRLNIKTLQDYFFSYDCDKFKTNFTVYRNRFKEFFDINHVEYTIPDFKGNSAKV